MVVVVTLIGIIVVIVVVVIIIIIFRGHVASNHWLDRAMLRLACLVAVMRLHDDEGRGRSVGFSASHCAARLSARAWLGRGHHG